MCLTSRGNGRRQAVDHAERGREVAGGVVVQVRLQVDAEDFQREEQQGTWEEDLGDRPRRNDLHAEAAVDVGGRRLR